MAKDTILEDLPKPKSNTPVANSPDLEAVSAEKTADVEQVEMETLAQSLFNSISTLRSNRAAFSDLNHFQQATLCGAHTCLGQALGAEWNGHPITLEKLLGPGVTEYFSLTTLTVHPELSSQPDSSRKTGKITVDEQTSPEAPVDFAVLGIPTEMRDEVVGTQACDLRAWLCLVFQQIKDFRSSPSWTGSSMTDWKRKLLQGVQIIAGQLLGLQDRSGPCTLQRYMQAGLDDVRLSNAVGYYKPSSKESGHRV